MSKKPSIRESALHELLSLVQETQAFLSSNYSLKTSFLFSNSQTVEKKVEQKKKVIFPVEKNMDTAKVVKKPILKSIAPPVAPIEQIEVSEKQPTASPLTIKPQVPAPVDSMEDLFALFSQLKVIKVTREIPDDSLAKELAEAWKNPISKPHLLFLFLKGNPHEERFFENVAKAVSLRLKPAKAIDATFMEKEKKWEQILNNEEIKWMFCSKKLLFSLPSLKSHYRFFPAKDEHFLHQTPLIFLEPFSSYAQNPSLKKQLWERLCQILKH